MTTFLSFPLDKHAEYDIYRIKHVEGVSMPTSRVWTFSIQGLGDFVEDFEDVMTRYAGNPRDRGKSRYLMDLYNYLHEVADGDADEYVRNKQEWDMFGDTPIYVATANTVSYPFIVFAVAGRSAQRFWWEHESDTVTATEGPPGCVVHALYCGYQVADLDRLWIDIIDPRCRAWNLA